MENTVFSKPAITKLARRAGVKSLSDDCFAPTKQLLRNNLREIIRNAIIVNEYKNLKTLTLDDVYETFKLLGINTTKTDEFLTKKV